MWTMRALMVPVSREQVDDLAVVLVTGASPVGDRGSESGDDMLAEPVVGVATASSLTRGFEHCHRFGGQAAQDALDLLLALAASCALRGRDDVVRRLSSRTPWTSAPGDATSNRVGAYSTRTARSRLS
jgi:hypothetical protein